MNAKEYLQQAYRLDVKIKANLMEIERLRELAASIPSVDLSQRMAENSGVADRVGKTVAKIVDLENEIHDEIDRLINLKTQIQIRINAVENGDYKLILQKRYLNHQTWEQISCDIHVTYRWIHVLHSRALKTFEAVHKNSL